MFKLTASTLLAGDRRHEIKPFLSKDFALSKQQAPFTLRLGIRSTL